ncbi:uncharacterized protein LOC127849575 [Dreissena polymorpha]|uniref:uncharacterized protein LOC127849575 n=1 Tax=Dreissena polymorpha TaxID=45954 RepID=UPI0022647D6A|nr:uncharacterized protein LOC127849575 [Dreissena polymorpha]
MEYIVEEPGDSVAKIDYRASTMGPKTTLARVEDVWFGPVQIIDEMGKLRKGDHIAVVQRKLFLGKTVLHHGIYTGDLKVIHATGRRSVAVDDILKFIGQSVFVRINYKKQFREPDIVVNFAQSCLQNPSKFGSFNIVKNNCEHFATLCKTGKRVSDQVVELLNSKIKKVLVNLVYQCGESSASSASSASSISSCALL